MERGEYMISVHGVKTVTIGPRIDLVSVHHKVGFWQTLTFFDAFGDKESIKIFFDHEGTPLPVTVQPMEAQHETV
jgi:hypothetical protein